MSFNSLGGGRLEKLLVLVRKTNIVFFLINSKCNLDPKWRMDFCKKFMVVRRIHIQLFTIPKF